MFAALVASPAATTLVDEEITLEDIEAMEQYVATLEVQVQELRSLAASLSPNPTGRRVEAVEPHARRLMTGNGTAPAITFQVTVVAVGSSCVVARNDDALLSRSWP